MKTTIHKIGPKCAKRTTIAIAVTDDGEVYIATNAVKNPITACPRQDLPTETGYELCYSVCNQTGHAEANVAALIPEGKTGIAFLIGHDHACEPCLNALEKAGMRELIIIDVNAR